MERAHPARRPGRKDGGFAGQTGHQAPVWRNRDGHLLAVTRLFEPQGLADLTYTNLAFRSRAVVLQDTKLL